MTRPEAQVADEALLAAGDVAATARTILDSQGASGFIPRSPGGPGDPWNHVEAAIALDLAGVHGASLRAYRWLAERQLADGSWFASYALDGTVLERHVDTNTVAYLATGLLVHLRSGGVPGDLVELADCLERALDFVLRHERGSGVLPWSIEEGGTAAPFSLLAGCSSVCSSLRHGAELLGSLDRRAGRFAEAAERLSKSIRDGLPVFADKSEYAMDWYYPVLSGVLGEAEGRWRLLEGASRFVTGDGVRCSSDRRWVTSAESAEAAIAYARVGDREGALRLLATVEDKRQPDGAYLTGLVYPERSEFPPGERSVYSAAAVLIANDVLAGGPAVTLFGPAADLPAGADLPGVVLL